MPDVRSQLRTATSAAHRELDLALQAFGPFRSPERYAAYLDRMHWLHASCRDSVAATSPVAGLPDPTGALLSAIEADLGAREARRGDWPSPQPPESEAGHWGVAYVIEGSSLGAPHVLAAARRALPEGSSCAYLAALAAGAEERWPRFAAALGALDIDPEPALDAARATFERARALFLDEAVS